MYTVKGAPKGGFRMFDDALDRHEMRESSVRVELGKAMVEDLFSLNFQPLVDARTGRLSSAEALLRSHAPALRDVSPHAMILTAESSGQINALTDWTLETASPRQRSWKPSRSRSTFRRSISASPSSCRG